MYEYLFVCFPIQYVVKQFRVDEIASEKGKFVVRHLFVARTTIYALLVTSHTWREWIIVYRLWQLIAIPTQIFAINSIPYTHSKMWWQDKQTPISRFYVILMLHFDCWRFVWPMTTIRGKLWSNRESSIWIDKSQGNLKKSLLLNINWTYERWFQLWIGLFQPRKKCWWVLLRNLNQNILGKWKTPPILEK